MSGLCLLPGLTNMDVHIFLYIFGFHVVPVLTANVALGKYANQTGVVDGMVAHQATDGLKDNATQDAEYYKSVCATADTGDPIVPAEWWVHLNMVFTVYGVRVWNTYNTAGSVRMKYFSVYVRQTDGTEVLCGTSASPKHVVPGGRVTFLCIVPNASSVRIKKTGNVNDTEPHRITLCEVEVEDSPLSATTTVAPPSTTTIKTRGPNIALNKPTNQTGTYMNDPSWTSDRAVDCLFDYAPSNQKNLTYCARIESPLASQPAEWWVDLQGIYVIKSVAVYNTLWDGAYFRLNNFKIFVIRPGYSDSLCGENNIQLPRGGSVIFDCPGVTVGQYVKFVRTTIGGDSRDDIRRVSLCEVEVSGELYVPLVGYTNQTVNAVSIKNTYVSLEWEQVGILPNTSQFYGYDIVYWTDASDNGTLYVSHTDGKTTVTTTISGLSPKTRYVVEVRPLRRRDGVTEYGRYYPQQDVTTTCVPDTPQNVTVTAMDGDSINVTFTLPSGAPCNDIKSVSVLYKLGSPPQPWSITDTGPNTTVVVEPLAAGIYQVKVYLTNTEDVHSDDTSIQTVMVSENDLTTAAVEDTTQTTETATEAGSGQSTGEGDNNRIAIIAGTVTLGVLLIIVVILVLVFVYRRRKPHKDTQEQVVTYAEMRREPPQPPVMVASGSVSSVEEIPFMSAAVAVPDLEKYVQRRKAHMDSLVEEFASLPGPRSSWCVTAQNKENKTKNRYLSIYPYDKTRVVLNAEGGSNETDYINANYISGYKGVPKRYIATQGPRLNTLHEFWRMVWQVNSQRIVMVANLVEGSKKRVEQYWSSDVGSIQHFGDFAITLEAEETCADYTTRTLIVQHQMDSRRVRQFHFTSWPDKTNPSYGPMSLLAFWKNVRSYDQLSTGPIVVHCSAGVGRSGTFIALDILADQAHAENQVDFYGVIHKLRHQRMHMTQTKDQYVFLHDALVEHVKYGDTSYPCSGLAGTVADLSAAPNGATSKIERQFQVLRRILRPNYEADDKSGLSAENIAKNRDQQIIPGDAHRPHLTTPTVDGNDYINAVYVDSFVKHNYYLVTQLPLKHTIADFWRLVYDHSCHTIIMLNSINMDDLSCDEYWPDEDEQSADYGPLRVTLLRESQITDRLIARDFSVDRANQTRRPGASRSHEVRQFQLLGWPQDQLLPSQELDLLDLLEHASSYQRQRDNPEKIGEVIVQCFNGRGASGIYCGISYVVEKMLVDKSVDAFMTVRHVAGQRPEFFAALDEYQVLYDIAVAQVDRYTTIDPRTRTSKRLSVHSARSRSPQTPPTGATIVSVR